jgi:hypothetical protein
MANPNIEIKMSDKDRDKTFFIDETKDASNFINENMVNDNNDNNKTINTLMDMVNGLLPSPSTEEYVLNTKDNKNNKNKETNNPTQPKIDMSVLMNTLLGVGKPTPRNGPDIDDDIYNDETNGIDPGTTVPPKIDMSVLMNTLLGGGLQTPQNQNVQDIDDDIYNHENIENTENIENMNTLMGTLLGSLNVVIPSTKSVIEVEPVHEDVE